MGEWWWHTCTHTHAHPWSFVSMNTHTSGAHHLQPFQECFHYTHTYKKLSTGYLVDHDTHTYTPIPMHTLDCLHKHTLLHVYRGVFLARIRRYTQLAYLFHQCATGLLSRDGRIADVLWDIRAWSARFLVFLFISQKTNILFVCWHHSA